MWRMRRRWWITAVGLVVVAVGVFAFDMPRSPRSLEAVRSYFPETGCDPADYDLSNAGYQKQLLRQTAFATYTSRKDAEDQMTIRVARYRPFGDWYLVAIER